MRTTCSMPGCKRARAWNARIVWKEHSTVAATLIAATDLNVTGAIHLVGTLPQSQPRLALNTTLLHGPPVHTPPDGTASQCFMLYAIVESTGASHSAAGHQFERHPRCLLGSLQLYAAFGIGENVKGHLVVRCAAAAQCRCAVGSFASRAFGRGRVQARLVTVLPMRSQDE